jgi:hypothetical protein
MEWLYFVAAGLVLALFVGSFMLMAYQEAAAFVWGFCITLAILAGLILIGGLLWMGLEGYTGS